MKGDLRVRLGAASAGDQTVEPTTSERDLIAAFGAANVTRDSISMGEGDYMMGTVLFADDSARRLEILWVDTTTRTVPASLRVMGSQSAWRIGSGVTLGSTIAEVERANGRPFTLTGFSWDYEGTVTSWDGGRFDSLPQGVNRIIVRFHPSASDQLSVEEGRQVAGDVELQSGNPAVVRAEPRVYALEVWFVEGGVGR